MPQHLWLLMTVRDRLGLTEGTIDSLRKTAEPGFHLIVVDNGSDKETRNMLVEEFRQGRIDRLILNPANIPQWQKSYAIRQAIGLLALADETVHFFGWIDNDVEAKTSWMGLSVGLLNHCQDIEVVSLCSCDPEQTKRHPVARVEHADGHEIHRKYTANGAFWIMRKAFFDRYGLPPIGRGITREGTEDWHYLDILKNSGGPRFACPVGMADHLGYQQSVKGIVIQAGE